LVITTSGTIAYNILDDVFKELTDECKLKEAFDNPELLEQVKNPAPPETPRT